MSIMLFFLELQIIKNLINFFTKTKNHGHKKLKEKTGSLQPKLLFLKKNVWNHRNFRIKIKQN